MRESGRNMTRINDARKTKKEYYKAKFNLIFEIKFEQDKFQFQQLFHWLTKFFSTGSEIVYWHI